VSSSHSSVVTVSRRRTRLSHCPQPALLAVAIVFALAATLIASPVVASAAPRPAAETRARAIAPLSGQLVAAQGGVVPGHVGRSRPPHAELVSATGVATISAPTSVIDDVMAETRAGAGNLTSKYTLTADEALTAGERWVGPGYSELGKPGSGVFRSADGTRQFRIDNGSITGAHSPGVPHVHLETISPGSKVPVANNHIPFTE
jgi:hypothetical protein